jgi:hypothetical protein
MIILNNNIVGRKIRRKLSELIHTIKNPAIEYIQVEHVGLFITNIKVGDIVAVYGQQLTPIILEEEMLFYTNSKNVIATI